MAAKTFEQWIKKYTGKKFENMRGAAYNLAKEFKVVWDAATKAAEEKFAAPNTGSPKLPACEQLYIGCAIDGASCGCDGDQSKCRQLLASAL